MKEGLNLEKTKKQQILDAALQLFAKRGYDGTTVPMIAEEAKVGTGTIYRYFENKEVLMNTLFQKCLTAFADELQKDFPYESNVKEQFDHMFDGMGRYASNHLTDIVFIDTHVEGYYLDEESALCFNRLMNFLESVIRNGQQSGAIKNLPSCALISLVYGGFTRFYKDMKLGYIEENRELLDGIRECCWDAVRIH